MASSVHHALLAIALVGSMFAACGGRTADVITGTGSSGASSGGSGGSSGGSSSSGSSSSGSSSSGSSSSSSSSGGGSGSPMCIGVFATSFNRTCNQASDCFTITQGTICTNSCLWGGCSAINVSEASRYQAEVSSLATGQCPCPAGPPPACSGNVCVFCTGAPSDPPECTIGPPPPPPFEAGIVCQQEFAGGSSGTNGGDCMASESCSDGWTYSVTCSCPAAVCGCTQSSANAGGSSGSAPFRGCPALGCGPSSVGLMYQACHFPMPP